MVLLSRRLEGKAGGVDGEGATDEGGVGEFGFEAGFDGIGLNGELDFDGAVGIGGAAAGVGGFAPSPAGVAPGDLATGGEVEWGDVGEVLLDLGDAVGGE